MPTIAHMLPSIGEDDHLKRGNRARHLEEDMKLCCVEECTWSGGKVAGVYPTVPPGTEPPGAGEGT